MKWRLYYGDGSVCSGESDEDAFWAPSISVQLLKQEADNDRGYTIRHGCEYFVWERMTKSDGTILKEGRWGGKNDLFGLSHYYFTHIGPQKVILGIEIHDDTYQEISRKAFSDGCLCAEPCNHIKPGVN